MKMSNFNMQILRPTHYLSCTLLVNSDVVLGALQLELTEVELLTAAGVLYFPLPLLPFPLLCPGGW